jgi:hypothetical protein
MSIIISPIPISPGATESPTSPPGNTRSRPEPVRVTVGADAVLDLTFPTRFELRGHVVDTDGRPLAGARIVAFNLRGALQPQIGSCDENGFFVFPVVNGTYRVGAAARGFVTPHIVGPIQVAGAPVDGIEIALRPGATVRGRVLGLQPGDPVKVEAHGPEGETCSGEVTDEGAYRLEGLPPGEWQVTASLVEDPLGPLYPVTRTVTVPDGPAERLLDLPLDLGDILLIGHLSDLTEIRRVHLLRRDGTAPEKILTSGEGGDVRFTHLRPGHYLLQVEGANVERELELTTRGSQVEVDLELPPNARP